MKYPIDIDTWMQEFKQVRPDATPEEEARLRDKVVPMINLAFDDGLHNRGGFPVSSDELINWLEVQRGCTMDERLKAYISAWMRVCNCAYEAGVQERRRGEVFNDGAEN